MINLSKCCHAPVTVEGGMPEDGDNGKTHYFVCTLCRKPCDLADVDSTKSQDLRELIAERNCLQCEHTQDACILSGNYCNFALSEADQILQLLDTPEGQAYLRSKGWVKSKIGDIGVMIDNYADMED